MCLFAFCAKALMNGTSRKAAAANAHVVLPRFCAAFYGSMTCACRIVVLATWENTHACDWLDMASAHAVFARFCAVKSSAHCSVAFINTANSTVFDWLAVANAHAMFAISCILKSAMHDAAAFTTDAFATEVNSRPSGR
eukprot:gnl/MRDRNA2_/MRDRNA2_77296_c0_seq2.p1 gnl/MRDRNA2_/MRDRNA2_77296_c0~~gnl/MRDRNA2_/MRDRNA2_77296_c0_seq2.p1  ORF type:complete len:139 (-),score=11.94 gnl/MRDRNA2_/MRDRNA2_77296_c0_seq2:96-512(-)